MEKKGLSYTAYGGIPGDQYEPYVPPTTRLPEMTIASIIMGILLAYSNQRVGMA